jgi:choline-sulfatase
MKLPKTWGKVRAETVPKEIRDWIDHHPWTPELRDPDKARERIAYYHACLTQMDEGVGTVLAALRDAGLEDDTIVIYTSDHGEMLGEHGLWQKFVMYEPSVGVPLMIRVPGLTRSAVCESPVSLIDLAPTLVDLTGVSPLPNLNGETLTPLLRDPKSRRRSPVFAEYGLGTKNPKFMIRDGKWKLVHYPNDIDELYDLSSDPEEMNNLAATAAHRKVAAGLREQISAWRSRS